MSHGYFRIDTFRQRQAAEGPEGWGRSCVCKSSHKYFSLHGEVIRINLLLALYLQDALLLHHFVKYSVG